MSISRRKFLKNSAKGALALGVAGVVMGCGADEDEGETNNPITGAVASKIESSHESTNHTHTIQAVVINGGAQSILLDGAGHTHTVEITSSQMATLEIAGNTLTLDSSFGGGHSHKVTFESS